MPDRTIGYLIGTFGLSIFSFFILGSWLKTDEPVIAYFLSLIASHLIIDKLDHLYCESKKPNVLP